MCRVEGGNQTQRGGDCTVQANEDGGWTKVGAEEVGSARFWITLKVGQARLAEGSDVGERKELRMFPQIGFQRFKTRPSLKKTTHTTETQVLAKMLRNWSTQTLPAGK